MRIYVRRRYFLKTSVCICICIHLNYDITETKYYIQTSNQNKKQTIMILYVLHQNRNEVLPDYGRYLVYPVIEEIIILVLIVIILSFIVRTCGTSI
jgi:hypothetical protein